MSDILDDAEDNLKENLSILRTIYAISLVFGYEKIANFLLETKFDWSIVYIMVFLCAVAMVLFSVRIFWAVGNIRRYAHEKIKIEHKKLLKDPGEGNFIAIDLIDDNTSRKVMMIHVPILLFHSFLFFILSDFYIKIMKDGVLQNVAYVHFGLWFCSLLFLNGIWLHFLNIKGEEPAHQKLWMWNNFFCAGAGFIFLLLVGSPIIENWPTFLGYPQFWVWAFLAVILGNSVIDYLLCSKVYLVGDSG